MHNESNALDRLPDAVFWIGEDGRIAYVNRAACKALGYPQNELLQMTIHDVEPALSRRQFSLRWRQIRQNGAALMESRLRKKDGAFFPVEISVNGLHDNGREYLCALARDITARKEKERALQASEERFRTLAELLPETVFEMDTEGRLTFVNKRAYEMFGYSRDEFENGLSALDMVTAEARPRALANLKARLRGEDFGFSEYTAVRKDGRTLPIMLKSAVIEHEGKVKGLRGFFVDITERKRIERKLEESEAKYRQLVEHAPSGIYEFDLQTLRFTNVNEVICEYTGYSREEFLQLDPFDLITEESHGVLENLIKELKSGKTDSTTAEYRIRGKNGRCFWVMVESKFFFENGVPKRAVCVAYDRTEFKRIEEEKKALRKRLNQSQKLEAIGTLAGGIAHDFNNILSSIMGYTELALDAVERNTSVEAYLREVYKAGKRSGDLVKQILTFARQRDEELKPVKVDSIAKEVLKLLRSTVSPLIRIEPDIASDALIMGDPSQVHQVFMNLCTNAVQAMGDEGGVLGVSLCDVAVGTAHGRVINGLGSGNYLKIAVSDTGKGIAEDQIDLIFEPYFTTKGHDKGTGLGLSVVHGIVKTYGGEITVDSRIGRGSVFEIYLPVLAKSALSASVASDTAPKGNERILFVDDEPPIADLNEKMLERLGYRVTTRTSSIEALQLFEKRKDDFDLVITDMMMPNMTGDQLASRLLRIRPDIPVILSTGYSEQIADKKASDIGVGAIIMKPISRLDMAKTIREVLDGV